MESLLSLIPRPYRRGRFAAPWHRPGYNDPNSNSTSTGDDDDGDEFPPHLLLYRPTPEPDPDDEGLWWSHVGPPFVRPEGHASFRRRRRRIMPEDILRWADGEIETVRELVDGAPRFDDGDAFGEEYDRIMSAWEKKRGRMRRRRRMAAAAAATDVDRGGRGAPGLMGDGGGDDEDSTDGDGDGDGSQSPPTPEDWDDEALEAALWRNAVRGGLVEPGDARRAPRARPPTVHSPPSSSRGGDGGIPRRGGGNDGRGRGNDDAAGGGAERRAFVAVDGGDVDGNAADGEDDNGEGRPADHPPANPAAGPAAAAAPMMDDRVGLFDDFEEDEEWLRIVAEGREAGARGAVAREVRRLREAGVPEEEFELIRIDAEEDDGNNALTLRRIFFAVLAVVVAFVCIMIQAAVPIFDDSLFDDDDGVGVDMDGAVGGGGGGFGGVSPIPMGGGGVGGRDGSSGAGSGVTSSSDVDHLMHELMEVRDVLSFCRDCGRVGGGGGDVGNDIFDRIHNHSESRNVFYDCGDGVLHIPTVANIRSAFPPPTTTSGGRSVGESSSSVDEESSLSPNLLASTPHYSVAVSAGGVNATWWYDCRWPPPADGDDVDVDERACLFGRGSRGTIPPEGSDVDSSDDDDTCEPRVPGGGGGAPTRSPPPPPASSRRASSSPRCFRGVHDGVFDDGDVDALLGVAAELIGAGGDHVAIRGDVGEALLARVPPGVLRRLGRLLRERYGIGIVGHSPPTGGCDWNATGGGGFVSAVRPVAFRFNAAISPIPNQFSPKNKLLEKILDEKTVKKWIEPMVQKHLKNSLLSFLFSSSAKPSLLLKEDPCYLLADLEARDDFVIHTTIFLSEKGAKEDHSGGTSFFLEEAEWRAHQRRGRKRHKYRKGLAVDGSRGRLIVSTGGMENLRCRLPVKAGVRAALQIWWDCAT